MPDTTRSRIASLIASLLVLGCELAALPAQGRPETVGRERPVG